MLDEVEREINQELTNKAITSLRRSWLAPAQDLIEKWSKILTLLDQLRSHLNVLLEEDKEEEQKGR